MSTSLLTIDQEATLLLNFAFAVVLSLGAAGIPAGPRDIVTTLKPFAAQAHIEAARPAFEIAPRAALPSAQAPKTSDLGVFRSVAISAARLPAAGNWHAARKTDYTAFFSAECESRNFAGCDSRFATKIRGLREQVAGLSDRATLDLVNRTVNSAMAYRSDKAVWGVGDYWANPVEMARKGAGDCEDFAIAKYWALRGLGLEDEQLQIVLLQDTRRQLFHAVLVVHTEAGRYVLDNVSNRLQADTAYAQYQPIMSFSGEKSFIHGFTGNSRNMAAMPKDLSTVAPGLGM